MLPLPFRCVTLLCFTLLLCAPALHAADDVPPPVDVVIDSQPSPTAPVAPRTRNITITFRGPAGHLFQLGERVSLDALLNNAGDTQTVDATILVSTLFGCEIYLGTFKKALPAHDTLVLPINAQALSRLPNGTYRIEVWTESKQGFGYGTTQFNIWPGALETGSDVFGISYQGPLNSERTWQELDLFRLAGVNWLRFPLQGWSPQGDAAPAEAEQYNRFVQEAGKRNYSLVAAFLPHMTVDPAVNQMQADKEYRESLLAAATRYNYKVKTWELLSIRPDPRYPELKGIGFDQIKSGREALRGFDKTLQAAYTLDDPFQWNGQDLFNRALPAEGDVVSMRYDFVGIPELPTSQKSPIYSMQDLMANAQLKLKKAPITWVTEYGFDAKRGERLPPAMYQAALLARAVILNRAVSIARTFWRHQPGSKYDLPLICDDGSAQPSLLAVRTLQQVLNGVTQVSEVPTTFMGSSEMAKQLRLLLLRYEPDKKAQKLGAKKHYMLAAWGENQTFGLSLKTPATTMNVIDLWGNAIQLQPTGGVAIFPVDEFPRFVDLGTCDEAEVFTPFAVFRPSRFVLHDKVDNVMSLEIQNNPRLFTKNISMEVVRRIWPGDIPVITQKIELNPGDSINLTRELEIPTGARKGQVYDVHVDFMVGTRRIGYLTMPVHYQPSAKEDE